MVDEAQFFKLIFRQATRSAGGVVDRLHDILDEGFDRFRSFPTVPCDSACILPEASKPSREGV